MKKKLNLSFCESLIHSDFFLTNKLESRSRSISYLNIVSLSKQLKQFIKLLKFLDVPFFDKKRKRLRLLNKKLYFFFKNSSGASMVQQYFSTSNLKNFVSVSEDENYSYLKINPKKKNACVSLGIPSNNNFFDVSVDKGLNLFTIFDDNSLKLRKIATYKVINKLENIKKKIFLIGLIEKVFSKRKKIKDDIVL